MTKLKRSISFGEEMRGVMCFLGEFATDLRDSFVRNDFKLDLTPDIEWRLLSLSLKHKRGEVLGFLKAFGVNIDIKNKEGRGLLHYAVFNDDLDSVKLLLDHGADIYLRDNNSDTPFMLACCKGNLSVIMCLYFHGGYKLGVEDKDPLGYIFAMYGPKYHISDRGELLAFAKRAKEKTPYEFLLGKGAFTIPKDLDMSWESE